jgi:hypothetical protein
VDFVAEGIRRLLSPLQDLIGSRSCSGYLVKKESAHDLELLQVADSAFQMSTFAGLRVVGLLCLWLVGSKEE